MSHFLNMNVLSSTCLWVVLGSLVFIANGQPIDMDSSSLCARSATNTTVGAGNETLSSPRDYSYHPFPWPDVRLFEVQRLRRFIDDTLDDIADIGDDVAVTGAFTRRSTRSPSVIEFKFLPVTPLLRVTFFNVKEALETMSFYYRPSGPIPEVGFVQGLFVDVNAGRALAASSSLGPVIPLGDCVAKQNVSVS